MKKTTLFLFLLFISIEVFSQSESEVLFKANELIKDKKYESAYRLLEDYDLKNDKPDVVLLKEKIALNYFVTSIMHQMFSFKDIQINEDINIGVNQPRQKKFIYLK